MTRIFEIERPEFNRIESGYQNFITVKDDKTGIRAGDVLVLQDVTDEEVKERSVVVEFTYYEGLKQNYVTCGFKEKE